jgi:hypothetical protein
MHRYTDMQVVFFSTLARACAQCEEIDLFTYIGDDDDEPLTDKALPRTKNEIAPPPPKRPEVEHVTGAIAKVGTITAVVEDSVIIQVAPP